MRGGIASLRHKLQLCSQNDVVTEGGEFKYVRKDVATVWGSIEAKASSTFSRHGAAMKDSRNKQTHIIMVRYNWDMNISAYAWLFEERRKSSPRWFKVLSAKETEGKGSQMLMLNCRLVERADDVALPEEDKPFNLATGLPEGVKL